MQGQRVLVVGAGRTGAAVLEALQPRGATLTLLETGSAEARDAAARWADADVTVVTEDGAITPGDFDVIVPSPGVPEHHPVLVGSATAGVDVWSEPELAWRLAGGRTQLVGVTGTNGKTTTTELLAACLDAPTGGNIGTPLVTLLSSDSPPPLVVAELSSFQLRFAQTLHPSVAVLLNVAPDHLDWHGTVSAYRAAKARLWQAQDASDVTVFNGDDEGARATVEQHPPAGGVVAFTLSAPQPGEVGVVEDAIVAVDDHGAATPVVPVDDLVLTGPHNVANACAAVAAARALGRDLSTLTAPLRSFAPGRHRLEHVATVDGVRYIDDSKATNPHAAAAALASFEPGRVVWIAGGLGKGLEFTTLAPLIKQSVKAAITIGTSGPDIAAVARAEGVDTVEAGTLDDAVTEAARRAQPGDVVLLAPACASMDQFTDYAHRGQVFRDAVTSLDSSLGTQGAGSGR